ncbi:Uncharacterised protein [Vibrio cholerae]|uniref:Uncharacterized protein n=1 Tax=Vibrio cholerae TaxID=666 RepID=A0A655QC75_VIBCL|nr:Uncharacterised protein [Vibrio cholerae]CSB67339.1 Uncharacterised protein [Vibrio cholerae]
MEFFAVPRGFATFGKPFRVFNDAIALTTQIVIFITPEAVRFILRMCIFNMFDRQWCIGCLIVRHIIAPPRRATSSED